MWLWLEDGVWLWCDVVKMVLADLVFEGFDFWAYESCIGVAQNAVSSSCSEGFLAL